MRANRGRPKVLTAILRRTSGLQAERRAIEAAIALAVGNISKAAGILQMTRQRLYDRIWFHDLESFIDEQRALRRKPHREFVERTRRELMGHGRRADADADRGVPGDER